MKIVHLCLSNFYIDNFVTKYSSKYNKDDGHEGQLSLQDLPIKKPGLADVGEYQCGWY